MKKENQRKYDLARSVVIRHLTCNLPKAHEEVAVRLFSSYDDIDFKNYLQVHFPYFLMCHDAVSPKKDNLQEGADCGPSAQSLALRQMILFFIGEGLNVALINGLEWKDTKIMTTVLERISSKSSIRVEPSLLAKFNPTSVQSLPEYIEKLNQLELELSERQRLVILGVTCLLQSETAELSDRSLIELTCQFILHAALLDHMSLSSRTLRIPQIDPAANVFLREMVIRFDDILNTPEWKQDLEHRAVVSDVADCIDGRLFLHVCCTMPTLSEPVIATAQKLLRGVQTLAEDSKQIQLHLTAHSMGHTKNHQGKRSKSSSPFVLPFSNHVFDKHLETIRLQEDSEPISVLKLRSQHIFTELTHWHNSKRPFTKRAPLAQEVKTKKRADKANQRQMADMIKYAASLTNAVGNCLEPETIIEGRRSSPHETKTDKRSSKPRQEQHHTVSDDVSKMKIDKESIKAGRGQNAKTSKKQEMLKQIAAKKKGKQDIIAEKAVDLWIAMCKTLEKEDDLWSKYEKASRYLSGLSPAVSEALKAEIKLYILDNLARYWIQNSKTASEELSALIWDTAKQIKQDPRLTKTIESNVDRIIRTFNLPPLIRAEAELYTDRELPFSCVVPTQLTEAATNLSAQDFQLMHAGPYLERSLDGAPDDRVDFQPDAWQRRVLNGLDAGQSLFVVAPTSAGKTYASFYAMRQVLEQDSDGIICYVAPTKALVNQIAAEIQARFSKSFKHAGKSVWAIHTRDYRVNNPMGCQILVTVPHVLQIMLLAPSNANSWSPRLRRIIFDEIHSIGNAEDGVVWEQLLLIAPCPIMALSATVGNPDQFSEWLGSTQKAVGQELVTIVHTHRYSDLRKYFYTPPIKYNFSGLSEKTSLGALSLEGSKDFTYLHPVACLVDKSRGIPGDLSLESRDCLLLWQCMIKHQTLEFPVPTDLAPREALPDSIRKKDVLKWEMGLKELLRNWVTEADSPYDRVVSDLGQGFFDGAKGHDPLFSPISTVEDGDITETNLVKTTLPLLCELHSKNALPAILFNFDRHQCEELCQTLLTQLTESEYKQIKSGTSWQKKIEKWKQWKINEGKRALEVEKSASKTKTKRGEDESANDRNDRQTQETSIWQSFDPNTPLPNYSFADHTKAQISELKEYSASLSWHRVPQYLVDALSRGIGVHHSGMNRKYRQVVEILFRKRFLRVVIATGTLALGINMPAKTVVFSGDSVFLTALNYRQCAGRAGRRGFDLLGNIVFHDISRPKVCRLMSSRLPDLNGHFPITTTLVLRLFTLLHGSKHSRYAATAINGLLSQPRLYLGGPSYKDATIHHLRFSIEYLRRQHLLDGSGAPVNFAGLVNHLYFTEPSGFAFTALLQAGYFHHLCADIHSREQDVLRNLMLVLSHLFNRIHLRRVDDGFKQKVVKPSSSIVWLPSLPEDAAGILQEHNEDTLRVFKNYVSTFVDQHIKNEDNLLPVTGLGIGGEASDFLESCCLPPTRIVSPFVALSGYGDNDILNIHELCETVRSGVFLEESVIPYIPVDKEAKRPLNAWLLDFYKHGDVHALETANGIRRSDVWFLLKDFSLALATIITSLQNYVSVVKVEDISLSMLDVMDIDETRQILADDEADERGSDGQDVNLDVLTLPSTEHHISKDASSQSRKKKVPPIDSWEDDADIQDESAGSDTDSRDAEATTVTGTEHATAPALPKKGQGLPTVLYALQRLNTEFTIKFRAIYA